MQKKISCSQISSLISFYRENSLNPKLKNIIDEHLSVCPTCRQLYSKSGLHQNNKQQIEPINEFEINLSAYMDNELSENDSVKFKKAAISNPITRENLESMYALKKAIQTSIEKTKNDFKSDYSKDIINVLKGEYTMKPFSKLAWTFAGMMSAILLGFLVISALYF